MSNLEEYDLVVLGSGRGRFFAWSLASQGKRAAVVERQYVTGSCPSIACLPSKYLIHGAKVASYFRRGAEFGIAPGDWKVDMPAVRDRKRKMIDGMVALNHQRYRESGAELVMGQGRFVGPKTIEVATADGGTRTLRGDVVVISTGSRARIDPIPGLAEARPMTHIEALELDRVPEHLLVLGGGYVGLELAQAMRRFGSRVTVIERNDALAHREDPRRLGGPAGALRRRGDRGPDGHARRSRRGAVRRVREAARDARRGGGRDRGLGPPGRERTDAEHRRHRPGGGRGRAGRPGLRQGRRAAPDHGPRRVGGGRLRRQPPLHAHRRRRCPRGPRQPRRHRPDDDRPSRAFLPVHRPRAGPGRPERVGGERVAGSPTGSRRSP